MYSAYLKKSHTIYPGGETTQLTSKRKLKIGRLCLSVFAAIAITTIGGYHFVLQSDLFLLKEISVIGNNRTPQNEIVKESGLVIGVDNIFSVPLRELAKKLEDKFSYMKNATLTKKMPGLITIKVVEREPVALIVHENAIHPPHISNGESEREARVEDLVLSPFFSYTRKTPTFPPKIHSENPDFPTQNLPSDSGGLNFLVDIEGFVLEIVEDVESFYKERIEQFPVQGNSVSQNLPLMNPAKSEKMNRPVSSPASGSFKNIILVTYGDKQYNSILKPRPHPQAGTREPQASTFGWESRGFPRQEKGRQLSGWESRGFPSVTRKRATTPRAKRQLNSPSVQLALSVIKHTQEAACELLPEVISINANNPKKITLSLKDGSIAFLEAGYLLAGLENLKTVLLHRKDRGETGGYIDARFSNVVYCGGGQNGTR